MLVARGTIAEAQHQSRAAVRLYRAALEVDPMSFDAAARLLDLLTASGRAREALSALERAVRLAPDSARHWALLGEARSAIRDTAGAETALRRALDLAPDGVSVRLALARALLMQQKSAQAIDVLGPVPRSVDRDVLLGSAYSAQRDWSRAVDHLQAALDAGGSAPGVLNALGWAHLQAGRRDEAARLFTRSLAQRSDQPEIRRLLDGMRSGIQKQAR
jgi:tetratricopeptide (TPR) repeat protein